MEFRPPCIHVILTFGGDCMKCKVSHLQLSRFRKQIPFKVTRNNRKTIQEEHLEAQANTI